MRFRRLSSLIAAIVVVLALAGAATALAVARDPGVTAPAPERIARSAVHSVTNAPEADATGGAPWSAHRVSPDSTSTLSETGVPETGVPETGVPETGVPETGVPETGVPETGVSETGVPETGVSETGVPETGVPSKAAAPPDSPTAPSLVQTGPVGADAVLETVNSPALPEGHGLQVNAAARAARDAAGRNGAGPPAQAAPVTSFDITLRPGANLISLPLVPDDIRIEEVLTGILDRVETVWQYDTSGPDPEWRSYAPGTPSDLRVMRDGPGYWVFLKDGGVGDAALTITGRDASGPARPVVRGWNLVGFTATSPQAPGEYLGDLSGSAGTTVVGYAGGTAEVVLPSAAPPQLMPGRGYWLYLEAAGTVGGAPPVTMDLPADRQDMVEVELEGGVRIVIPPGATTGALGDESSETVTVAIKEVGPPAQSMLPLGRVFGFSIVDQEGRDVPLREPVEITLPYTLAAGQNADDMEMLHWDDQLKRWELVEGAVVDPSTGTMTAEVDDLSMFEVSGALNPMQFLGVAMLSLVGATGMQASYDAEFKHLVSLNGKEGVRLPFLPFVQIGQLGVSLVIDLDDLVSILAFTRVEGADGLEALLPGLPGPITVEGADGFVTFGLNGHAALSVAATAGTDIGVSFAMPKTGRYRSTGYNTDLSFETSISALSVGVPGASASFGTVNKNGNFSKVNAQLGTCLECKLELKAEAKLADTTVNILKGEFNSNVLFDALSDFLEHGSENCAEDIPHEPDEDVPPSLFSTEMLCSIFAASGAALTTVLTETIYAYSEYEHLSPTHVAALDASFFNIGAGALGGKDVDGDGDGEMVFPAGGAGWPLEILISSDRYETREYFLELVSLPPGWRIELDENGWEGELNESPSDDAIFRVDFTEVPLVVLDTRWRVTTEEDAPNEGLAEFRLVHNKALFVDDVTDEFAVKMWREKPFSELSLTAAATPDPVASGEMLTYTVRVENRGPDPADNVELNMLNVLSTGLVLREASDGGQSLPCELSLGFWGRSCSLGGIAAEETVEVTLQFELAVSLPDDVTVPMNFAVESEKEDPNLANNTVMVETEVRLPDRVALDALYRGTGGSSWTYQGRWLGHDPIGKWYGVTTDGIGRVTALDLYQNHLTGTIPPELAGLPSLKQLHLSGNGLSGEIPGELGDLTQLEQLIASSNRLSGEIPPELGDLGSLTWLHLSDNQLTGGIPAWLGRLSRLERLSLSRNQMTGQIPAELGGLPNLQFLRLQGNQLTGCIPAGLRDVPDNDLDELGLADCASGDAASDRAALVALYNATGGRNWGRNGNWLSNAPMGEWHGVTTDSDGRVTHLHLYSNRLTGEIPAELGNLTNLRWLYLRNNQLTGEIPAELGSLTNLKVLYLHRNQLTGEIPAELGNLANLQTLHLYSNRLTGEIPAELGDLTNLKWLDLYSNRLTGEIPAELGNLTNLEVLHLYRNQLTGEIPAELGSLPSLQSLWLQGNQLTGEIPAELGNLTNLERLSLYGNQLTGEIPAELGYLTNLEGLFLYDNQLTGEIPAELGGLTKLELLSLYGNQLTGEIPAELGDLTNLKWLDLYSNRLTGEIPAELGSLTNLRWLRLEGNQLTGCIPEGLRNMATNDLDELGLADCASGDAATDRAALVAFYNATGGANWRNNGNWLSNAPIGAWHGVTTDSDGRVTHLLLASNQLTGEIPAELGDLTNLEVLSLSGNQLTGEIPAELGSLTNVEVLWLASNQLTGEIPAELGDLTNLEVLLLFDNQLTGEIPAELGDLTNLRHLRLHNNQLTGEIPAELGNLTNLIDLYLYRNQLTGCIPEGLRNIRRNDFGQLGLPFCGS